MKSAAIFEQLCIYNWYVKHVKGLMLYLTQDKLVSTEGVMKSLSEPSCSQKQDTQYIWNNRSVLGVSSLHRHEPKVSIILINYTNYPFVRISR